jgi:hypothetical protein
MKNKLIFNIVLVYFVLLAVVLLAQMKISRSKLSTDPLISNTRYSDTLSSCIVLHDRSPVMLVKQKQRLVSQKNAAAVPVINDDEVLVPLEFFDEAYDAVISSDKDKQTATVRLNNKALMVDGKTDSVKVVSASGESKLKTKSVAVFKNNSTYINLESFAEGFDKQLTVCDGMALLSDSKISLSDESDFVSEVSPRVYNLPSVDEQQKLESLLGSNPISIFNTLDLSFLTDRSPAATLGLDAITTDSPSMLRTDDSCIYRINGDRLVISDLSGKELSSTELNLDEAYGIYLSGKLVSVVGGGNVKHFNGNSFSGCIVNLYDVSEPSSPQLERTIAAEGTYTNAYKTDNTVYLFAKKTAESADSYGMPTYFDSANDTVGETKSLSDVHYIPEMADKKYTSLVSFNTADLTRAVNVYPILGCGDNYTVTGDSLYIAAASSVGTSVYRLALSDGVMQYSSAASAVGEIPDTACINEYNGVLRLASADGNKTDVTLLDDKMDVIDTLEDIRLDGDFVSTRFIGSRGYLVSDNDSTPITALDLGDKPKELGSVALPKGTAAVRNLDAEHFICFKENGDISMLSIADMDNQFEMYDVSTGGIYSYKDILLNTTDGVLVVPVEINNKEVTTETESVTEVGTEIGTEVETETATEDTTETATETATETTTEASHDTSSWCGVLVYKTEPTAFVLTNKIKCGDIGDDFSNMLYKDGVVYISYGDTVKRTKIDLSKSDESSIEITTAGVVTP